MHPSAGGSERKVTWKVVAIMCLKRVGKYLEKKVGEDTGKTDGKNALLTAVQRPSIAGLGIQYFYFPSVMNIIGFCGAYWKADQVKFTARNQGT